MGARELLSLGGVKMMLCMVGVLALSNFPMTDVDVYKNIALSSKHQECFNFIRKQTEESSSIYTNANPPSTIAWYKKI